MRPKGEAKVNIAEEKEEEAIDQEAGLGARDEKYLVSVNEICARCRWLAVILVTCEPSR